VGRTEFDVVAGLGDDRELDLCTVAQIVLVVCQALAVVPLFVAVG
jgi:hypothetical protein